MNRIPPHAPGMKIGLFGGTFDPPHEAHLAACLLAMKRLRLDRVWWLVTPGNPLKDTRGLAPLTERMAAARVLASHPRINITDLEAGIGTRYTHETILYLRKRCPGVRLVWIMGADNLRSFHRWQRWRGIAGLVPIAVVDRLAEPLCDREPRRAGARALSFRKRAWSLPTSPAGLAYIHGLKSPLSHGIAGQTQALERVQQSGIRQCEPSRANRLESLGSAWRHNNFVRSAKLVASELERLKPQPVAPIL